MWGNFFNIKRLLSLTFLVVFLGIYFNAPAVKGYASAAKKEKQARNESGEKASLHQLSIEAILPALNAELPDLFICSFIERPLLLEVSGKPSVTYTFTVSRFFRSLFTCIISPNAP